MRTRRRGWRPSRPPARRIDAGAALVTFSGDKLLGGPQAGIIAGRADLVARCARHPLARALRPGGLVLAALQDLALAYLRRDVVATVPFWRMAATPVEALQARAEAVAARDGRRGRCRWTPLPGAGSAPGTTIPSFGVRLDGRPRWPGCGRTRPRSSRASRDGATFLDLRAVEPADDVEIVAAIGRQSG